MMARALSNREKNILWISAFIVFFYAAHIFSLKLEKKIADLEDRVEIAEKKKNRGRRIIEQAAQFLDPPMTASFSILEQKLPDDSSLRLLQSTSERIDIKSKSSIIRFRMTMEGEFIPIIKFLHDLESPPYYYFIEELRLEASSPVLVNAEIVFSRPILL